MNAPHAAPTGAVTTRRGSFWLPGEQVRTPAGTIQHGQMHVEWETAEETTRDHPLILVHGGGGQATDWKRTADGRPGWAQGFVRSGYPVYTVDRPGHGRSPYHPLVWGGPGAPSGLEATIGIFLTPAFEEAHTQWPWDRSPEGAELQQFWASSGFIAGDFAAQQEIEARRLAELLDRTGPAILVAHSLGAGAGWLAANRRPGSVVAIAAIEPFGPPFAEIPGVSLPWGLTAAAIGSDPSITTPAQFQAAPTTPVPGWEIPIGVFAAEASPIGLAAPSVVEFLTAHGGRAEEISFAAAGVRGNGHGVMLEQNSEEALAVVIDWIEGALA